MLKLVVFHLPNVLIFGSYILFFWSNEGSEPVHIHVAVKRPSRVSAKFCILEDGSCKLANNHADIPKKDLKRISEFIQGNIEDILKAWKDFFVEEEIRYYK